MKNLHSTIIALLKLVDRLNRRSDRDPLGPPTRYTISVRSPDPETAADTPATDFLVRIDVQYESGGGEESSYAVQDSLAFHLDESGVSRYWIEEDGMREPHPDATYEEVADGSFLEGVAAFCEARLRETPPLPEV